ncbi:MAG: nickel insertion protein, partial [Actinomycetota bacterium]
GAPTYSRGIPVELVTPVGAALMAALAEGYGDMPTIRTDAIGYGAGELRLDFPHVLRVSIGEHERGGSTATPEGPDEVLVLARTEGDPSHLSSVVDAVMEAGARDAWVTAVAGPAGATGGLLHAVVGAAGLETVTGLFRDHGAEVRVVPLHSPP